MHRACPAILQASLRDLHHAFPFPPASRGMCSLDGRAAETAETCLCLPAAVSLLRLPSSCLFHTSLETLPWAALSDSCCMVSLVLSQVAALTLLEERPACEKLHSPPTYCSHLSTGDTKCTISWGPPQSHETGTLPILICRRENRFLGLKELGHPSSW